MADPPENTLNDVFDGPEDPLFLIMLIGGICMAYNFKSGLASVLTPFLVGAVATFAHSPSIASWIPVVDVTDWRYRLAASALGGLVFLAAYSYLLAAMVAYMIESTLGRMVPKWMKKIVLVLSSIVLAKVQGWLEVFIRPLFGAMFTTLSIQHFAVAGGFLDASAKCGIPWLLGGICTAEDKFQLYTFAAVLVSAIAWRIYQMFAPKKSKKGDKKIKVVKDANPRGRSKTRLRKSSSSISNASPSPSRSSSKSRGRSKSSTRLRRSSSGKGK